MRPSCPGRDAVQDLPAGKVICERCGTVFCWDGADQILVGGSRKRFCDDKCARNAARAARHAKAAAKRGQKMLAQPAGPCPTPGKLAFPEPGDALAKAVRASRATSAPHRAYRCPCGYWHLTTKQANAPSGTLPR